MAFFKAVLNSNLKKQHLSTFLFGFAFGVVTFLFFGNPVLKLMVKENYSGVLDDSVHVVKDFAFGTKVEDGEEVLFFGKTKGPFVILTDDFEDENTCSGTCGAALALDRAGHQVLGQVEPPRQGQLCTGGPARVAVRLDGGQRPPHLRPSGRANRWQQGSHGAAPPVHQALDTRRSYPRGFALALGCEHDSVPAPRDAT